MLEEIVNTVSTVTFNNRSLVCMVTFKSAWWTSQSNAPRRAKMFRNCPAIIFRELKIYDVVGSTTRFETNKFVMQDKNYDLWSQGHPQWLCRSQRNVKGLSCLSWNMEADCDLRAVT